jgi:uncharacterized protein (TIGR02145 family)
MFLPAHGYRAISNGSHQQGGAHGHYWSNSAATGSPATTAHALYLSAAQVSVDNTVGVSMGYNVRCVRQDGATTPELPPAAVLNSRITWDGSKYALTTDPSDAGLYFKFGGVAGVYSADHTVQTLPGANGDTFDAGDVAWSPTTVTAWASVPSYVAADYPNMVTAPVYHNATNVKAGKGDPCRLVGLDLARIATTAAGSLTAADIDNGQWRLPTNAETQTFSGQTSNNGSYTAHWTTVGGVNGGMFPNATDGSAATFLPVAGYRSTSGGVNSQGSSGYYWSSQAGSSSNGYSLGFHSSRVYPMGSNDYAYGFPVRCVRQDGATPPPPAAVLAHSSNTVPASGIIPMEGGTYTVNVSTNLQDWEVRVYEGSNPVPIVTKAANPSPAIDRNAAPVASTTTVAVPTNLLATATADRSLVFVLHSSEGGEVRLGSFIQRGYNRNGDNRRITWDEVTGRYLLTTDPSDGGLYFTFGGVAGLYSGNGGIKRLSSAANTDSDDFDAGDVAWSPVAIPVNDGLPGVPIYEEDDFPADVTPADGYHTAANVKRGKGDPCRLVGLDLGRIASTPAASLSAADIDNGQWRLPTEQENNAFSGTEGYSSDAHWTSIDMTYGGMFPNATLGNTGTFLPAAGYRSGGTAMDYNYSGYYLSSHADEVADGLALTTLLMFDEYSVPFYHLYADEGAYSVRCVRQQEGDRAVEVTPVTQPRNYRVTWDGGSGRYTLTDNPTDAGLYFKFGGVAGVYSANHAVATLPATNADPFDAGDVAWSPTTVTTWASVPVYADYPANVDAAYHTAANVKAGKGDPCRLVGLDLARIKATAAGSLTNADIDNGTWRLPTNAENQSLSGQMSNNDSYSAHWMTAATGPGGVAGGMFPNVASGSTATFFPAAGFRFSDTGTVGRQTTAGDYWSFAPISAVGGYTLYFASGNVSPLVENYYDHGFPVRCVRQ